MRIVVAGDAMLDRDVEGAVTRVCPDAPVPVVDERAVRARPGGAALAAAIAAGDGHEVTLVAAIAADAAGEELRAVLAGAGVRTAPLTLDGATPEKIRIRAAGQSLLRLDRGDAGAVRGPLEEDALAALASADAILVADYGGGVTALPELRAALETATAPLVWDPHRSGAPPIAGATLATPNLAEAQIFAGGSGDGVAAIGDRAARLLERWSARAVAVTCGDRGAVVALPTGPPVACPAPFAAAGDPCGAGDRFAVSATAALANGADAAAAVAAAVAEATAFVSRGGAAGLRPGEAMRLDDDPADDAVSIAARVRDDGGVVVATGGCFDLLHAGHVQTLRAARALGDCLIVCVNDDDSVRRLKGPGRPLVPLADRVAVLAALGCVDAVVAFGETLPNVVLRRLRPHLWVKGGDYAGADLPESRALASWGGRTVLLPQLPGRSTTKLIEEVAGGVR